MDQTPFDYFEFHSLFSDIKAGLAELKYIDDCFAYFEEERKNWPSYDTYDSFWVEFGGRYPFKMVEVTAGRPFDEDPYASPGKDRVEARMSELSTAATDWAYPAADQLRESCFHVLKAYGPDFQTVAESLTGDILFALDEGVYDDVGRLGESAGRWFGGAAIAFEHNFSSPFVQVKATHRLVLARMALCYGIAKAIIEAGQQSLMNAVVALAAAVDEQLRYRAEKQAASGSSDAEAWILVGNTLSVIGGAAALTVVGATPGAAIAAVGGAVSYIAGLLPAEAADPQEIKVARAEDVLAQLDDWIGTTLARYTKQYWEFSLQDVQSVKSALADAEAVGSLFPPQPRLHGVSPEDFHHSSSEQYPH